MSVRGSNWFGDIEIGTVGMRSILETLDGQRGDMFGGGFGLGALVDVVLGVPSFFGGMEFSSRLEGM